MVEFVVTMLSLTILAAIVLWYGDKKDKKDKKDKNN